MHKENTHMDDLLARVKLLFEATIRSPNDLAKLLKQIRDEHERAVIEAREEGWGDGFEEGQFQADWD